jgi:hypothetical protein
MQNMLTAYLNEKYHLSPTANRTKIGMQIDNTEVINLKMEIRKLHGDLCKKDEEINVYVL